MSSAFGKPKTLLSIIMWLGICAMTVYILTSFYGFIDQIQFAHQNDSIINPEANSSTTNRMKNQYSIKDSIEDPERADSGAKQLQDKFIKSKKLEMTQRFVETCCSQSASVSKGVKTNNNSMEKSVGIRKNQPCEKLANQVRHLQNFRPKFVFKAKTVENMFKFVKKEFQIKDKIKIMHQCKIKQL